MCAILNELQGKPSNGKKTRGHPLCPERWVHCGTSAANPEDLKAWVLGFPGEHWQSHKLAKLPEMFAHSDAQVAIY